MFVFFVTYHQTYWILHDRPFWWGGRQKRHALKAGADSHFSQGGLWVTFTHFLGFDPTPLFLSLPSSTLLRVFKGTLRTKDLIVLCSQAAEVSSFYFFKFYQVFIGDSNAPQFTSFNSCVNSPTQTPTPGQPLDGFWVYFYLWSFFKKHKLKEKKKVFLWNQSPKLEL